MNKHDKPEKPKQLNLKDPEIYELAEKVAALSGSTKSGAVKAALREKLERDEHVRGAEERYNRIRKLGEWYSSLPREDSRTPEEILGYDANGLPT